MKDQLSALEVFFLVQELQVLLDAKVEKVFGREKPDDKYFLSFHSASAGKRFLYVQLPSILTLADFKPEFPSQPPHDVASFRRKITNARVQAVEQIAFERIVKFTLSTKHGLSYLYIELFTPGNIILTDDAGTILALRHHKTWSERRNIRPGQLYALPEQQLNPQEKTVEELISVLNNSDKKIVVKALAIELSLGGTYAQLVLQRVGLEQTAVWSELSRDKQEEVVQTVQRFFIEESAPCQKGDEIFPITIEGAEPVDGFCKAIAAKVFTSVEQEEEKQHTKVISKSKNKFEKIVQAQQAQLKGLQKQSELAQKQGEYIYAHYAQVQQLLQSFQEDLKTLSVDAMNEKYLALPFIKEIDWKEKTLVLEVKDE